MLFNSYLFLFGFLPLTLAGFFLLGRMSPKLALTWMMAASLLFHAWWNWLHTLLMALSIAFNYAAGMALLAAQARRAERLARGLLVAGVVANLSLLAYFKYAAFLLGSLMGITGGSWVLDEPALPLGISFFTFTQIAFLVDARQRKVDDRDAIRYSVFVTYFPHLLAGPIIHHREIMRQFAAPEAYRPNAGNIAVGLAVFLIGLCKKVVLADGCIAYVEPVFNAAPGTLGFFQAWGGALGYGLQLYFDFSGYSDMAIGLSLMFGIRLPLNFNSPYQATSIIDFWRRWHMSLSRFLKDNLYIPLGGNRHGPARRYLSLMLTMLLGGLWHGAAWTFVVWGGLHGVLLVLNHGFRALTGRLGWRLQGAGYRALFWLLTFGSVTACWVFFRADSLAAATDILYAMSGARGITLPGAWQGALGFLPPTIFAGDFDGGMQLAWSAALLGIAILAPNTARIMGVYRIGYDSPPHSGRRLFRLHPAYAVVMGLAAWLCLIRMASGSSSFIYYNF